MSEAFRDISPDAPELQPIISGLFAEYAARYGDYFSRDAEVELSEWYVPPQGLFIVLEREGEIIATGAYKPKDRHTAEIKRIWTHRRLRQQGLAAKVVQELERRAVLAGYSHIYLTTGFRQPEAVKLYLSQGYEAQFDLTRDPEEYSQPPYDGRLRFTKALAVSAFAARALVGFGDTRLLAEGVEFTDFDSFKRYMRKPVKPTYDSGGEFATETAVAESPLYYENDTPIYRSQTEGATIEDDTGNVLCYFIWRNRSVVLWRTGPKADGYLPVTVYTQEAMSLAQQKAKHINTVFYGVYAAEAVAALVIYLRKREK